MFAARRAYQAVSIAALFFAAALGPAVAKADAPAHRPAAKGGVDASHADGSHADASRADASHPDGSHADASHARPAPHERPNRTRTARVQKAAKAEPRTCAKPAVEVAAGADHVTFSLSRCDGAPAPLAIERLSILARPASAAKPTQPVEALAKTKSADIAPGIHRVDAGLVARLERVVEHFHKAGQASPPKVELVSGVRPKSAGSYHQTGRAIDFRIEGVANEDLVAFCKTLEDTGCGFYPNSLFVHMDVRDRGAGHVSWIDISGPGQPPHYVAAWPMPAGDAPKLPALPGSQDAPAAMMAEPLREAPRRHGRVYFF
jgi:hypothetical protein